MSKVQDEAAWQAFLTVMGSDRLFDNSHMKRAVQAAIETYINTAVAENDDDDDGPDDECTIAEAKAWLESRKFAGAHCPCCEQLAKIYRRKLNSAMARDLIWLVRKAATQPEGWVEVSLIGPISLHRSRELAKLVYWGLVEPRLIESVRGARTSGIWRPTSRGIAFANGRIALPKYVLVYNGEFLGYSPDGMTTITDALGDNFSYAELWGAAVA
jgi:hypothetical protein